MTKAEPYTHSLQPSVTTARRIKVALFNFLLAASVGVLLRYAFVHEVKWLNYKAFQNAHSHLALLGWGYLGFFALLLSAFTPSSWVESRRVKILFWLSQSLIFLAAVSYAVLGNTVIPNILVILFSITVFVFTAFFVKGAKPFTGNLVCYRFATIALIFLCLSFLGTYAMFISLLISGTKKILLYYLSTQFFLHFQYNGWFSFAIFALFFRLVENKGIALDPKNNKRILWGLTTGVILTFFLSLFWGNQSKLWLLAVASAGGLIQILTILIHRKYLQSIFSQLTLTLNKSFRALLIIALCCFLIKLLMQVVIVVPFIATLAFTIRNYVIAYIHLVFIGMVSLFLFAWSLEHGFITVARTVRIGVFSLVTGFILVELVLFIQGTLLWMGKGFLSFYYPLLFLLSVLIPLGLLIITLKNLKYIPFKNQLQ
jgi:hypothetical protein